MRERKKGRSREGKSDRLRKRGREKGRGRGGGRVEGGLWELWERFASPRKTWAERIKEGMRKERETCWQSRGGEEGTWGVGGWSSVQWAPDSGHHQTQRCEGDEEQQTHHSAAATERQQPSLRNKYSQLLSQFNKPYTRTHRGKWERAMIREGGRGDLPLKPWLSSRGQHGELRAWLCELLAGCFITIPLWVSSLRDTFSAPSLRWTSSSSFQRK